MSTMQDAENAWPKYRDAHPVNNTPEQRHAFIAGYFAARIVAEEPEWESEFIQYGHVLGADMSGVFLVEPRGKNYSTHQRRVKLGRPSSSWFPVKQEDQTTNQPRD